MKRLLTTAVAALSLAALASCADQDADEMDADAAQEMVTPEEAPGMDEPEAAPSPLGVARLPDGGSYLTDASGRALYMLEGEQEGRTTCDETCALEWPPYVVTGAPSEAPATTGVDATLLGTRVREDGRTQVTYAGHALYLYSGDTGAGQTAGQDLTDRWGEWYLVQPSGNALETGEAGEAS